MIDHITASAVDIIAPLARPGFARRERRRVDGQGLRAWLGATTVVLLLCLGPVAAEAGVSDLYDKPSGGNIGAELWSGGQSVPGSPGTQAGCAPTVQQAHGIAYDAGVRSSLSITRSERQPPGKILTNCVTQMLALLQSLDVFSKASVGGALQTALQAVMEYAETAICSYISDQFNNAVQTAFNSIAFLNDVVPCGVGLSLPGYAGGGGNGLGVCNALGGPLVNIGTPGGTIYTSPTASVIPPLVSRNLGVGGTGNALQSLLGR